MSFISYNKIKSALAVLAAVIISVSCMQKEDFSGEVGYLHSPAFDVDLTVEDLAETKAVELFDIPEVSEVTFVVKDKDGKEKYNAKGLWTEAIVLPVGSYTITAEYGDNIFGSPYFTASVTGTIDALDKEEPVIRMNLGNSLVHISVSSDMASHFTPASTVSLASGGTSVTVGYGTWYYVPSGSDISISLNGNSSTGENKTFEYTLSAPAAKVAYRVVCGRTSTNWPTITLPDQQGGAWNTRLYIDPATVEGNISDANKAKIVYEVSASAEDWVTVATSECVEGDYHVVKGLTNGSKYYVRARIGKITSDVVGPITVKASLNDSPVSLSHDYSSGTLTGSSATLDLGFTDILKEYVDNGLLAISSTLTKSGTQMRTSSSYAATMDVTSGWPYLPQGSDYVLTVSHSLTSDAAATTSTVSGISSPAPSFTVSLTSYSSYDKYLENNIDAANATDAYTVKNLGASWTIASALVSSSNYKKSFEYNNNGTKTTPTISGTSYSAGDKSDLAVGTQYKVSASLTFDGVTKKTIDKTHYITGLPYIAAPPKEADWTPHTETKTTGWLVQTTHTSVVNFNEGATRLIGKQDLNAYITHNGFYTPSGSINVHIDNAYYGIATAFAKVVYTLTIGGQTIVKTECGDVGGKDYTLTKDLTIGSYEEIKINSFYSSSNEDTFYFDVKTFNVTYGAK